MLYIKHRPSPLANHLILATFFLTLLGLLTIYAASALKSAELYGHPYHFLYKQMFGATVGFASIYLLHLFSFIWIEHLTLPLLILSIITLILVFVPNIYTKVGGASRWLRFGSLSIQPAELVKVALVFFLAKNLSRSKFKIANMRSALIPNLLVLAIFSICLMKQPDFGSVVLLFIVTFLMLFVAGLPKNYIISTIVITCSLFAYAVVSAPYRLKRLISFLDPWSNASSGGFQIIQSYLAFKNGGLFGLGQGLSKQKLFFLPEAHTDFILSVLAEEMGLLGVLLVFVLYFYIVLVGYRISIYQKNKYRKYLAFGLTSLLATQTCLNIAVVTGLVPTKGIPLPFVSSGVSSLLSFLFCIAILARLASETTIPTTKTIS